jgi:hypothetical protein
VPALVHDAQRRDAAAAHGHVGVLDGRAGAVDHRRVPNDQVEHLAVSPLTSPVL